MTLEQKLIYNQIDSILWNDWDPIGVNDFESARDEYYDYIPVFLKKVYDKATLMEIADKLTFISINTMGLLGNRGQDITIAQKIFKLESLIETKSNY